MIAKTPLIFFLGLSLHLGAGECNVMRTVPVRLFNDAAVPPKMMIAAQNEAAWVLRSLCVEIEWVRSPSTQAPSTQAPSTQGLDIRIIATPLPHSTSTFALGMTTLNPERGKSATVFFSRVRETRRQHLSLIRLDVLLGCVLAHEIGHLLLSTTAHSPDGVMAAHFGEDEVLRAAQRRLVFTRSDRETFSRSQIAHRIYDATIAARR